MAIITISRQTRSLGDEIAKATAEKLGYELVEKPHISKALSGLGFSVPDFDKYDEKKPTIWQTLSTQKILGSSRKRVPGYMKIVKPQGKIFHISVAVGLALHRFYFII